MMSPTKPPTDGATPVQRSFRLPAATLERLDARARERGQSANTLAARLIEEGLRTEEHPLVYFRDGAAGRRPAMLGTRLDVWQVVETLRAHDGSVGRPRSTWTSRRSRSAPPSTTTARTRTRSTRSPCAPSKRPAARRTRCGARPRPREGLPRRALRPEDRRRAAHPRSRRDQRPRSARARRAARRTAVRPHGRRGTPDRHRERD